MTIPHVCVDREASIKKRPWRIRGCCAMGWGGLFLGLQQTPNTLLH
jgi:hypothetical protein